MASKDNAEARTDSMPGTYRTVIKRGPRTVKPKTFDDHFADFSAAYRAMNSEERGRAVLAVQALYPNATSASRATVNGAVEATS